MLPKKEKQNVIKRFGNWLFGEEYHKSTYVRERITWGYKQLFPDASLAVHGDKTMSGQDLLKTCEWILLCVKEQQDSQMANDVRICILVFDFGGLKGCGKKEVNEKVLGERDTGANGFLLECLFVF